MPVVVMLSNLLGRTVVDEAGTAVGRLRDLTVTTQSDHPTVTGMVLGTRRGSTRLLPWHLVSSIAASGPVHVRLGASPFVDPAPERDLPLEHHELLVARDVVDTQVVDLQDFRVARVSDLYLERRPDGAMQVTAADIGLGAVLRRMGLGWVGRLFGRVVVDWTDLHLTSRRGHEIQLASSTAAFHGLDSQGLAELLASLSTQHATELIRALPPRHAAAALHRSHPTIGRRLIRALRHDVADALIAAAHPTHAARLAELKGRPSTTPTGRRLLRTAGWRRYRPAHASSGPHDPPDGDR